MKRIEHDALRGGGQVVYVHDVVGGESGQPWLGVGYVVDGDGNRTPSAWTSSNGATWSRFAMEATGAPEARDGPFHVARRGNVAVAVGDRFDTRRRPAAWWSTSPNVWNAVKNPTDELLTYEGEIQDVAATPIGFYALGNRDTSFGTVITFFYSADGRAWHLHSVHSTRGSRVRPNSGVHGQRESIRRRWHNEQ